MGLTLLSERDAVLQLILAEIRMRILTCFGDRTRSGAFFIIALDEDHR